MLAEPGCPREATPESLNRAQLRQGFTLYRERSSEQVRMQAVKLNQLRLFRGRAKEAGALAGDREALRPDQVDAGRPVQPELPQRIPEAILWVAEFFDTPAVGWARVVADGLNYTLT